MHTLTHTQRSKWRKRATTIALNSAQNLLTPALNIIISALVVRLASKAVWGEFIGWLIMVQLMAQGVAWGNKEYLLRHFAQHPQTLTQTHRWAIFSRIPLLMLALAVLLVLDMTLGVRVGLMLWLIATFVVQSLDVMVVFRRDFGFAVMLEVLVTLGMVVGVLLMAEISAEGVLGVFIIGAWGRAVAYAWRYAPPEVQNIWLRLLETAKAVRKRAEISHIPKRFNGDSVQMSATAPHEAVPLGTAEGTQQDVLNVLRSPEQPAKSGYIRLAMPFFLLGLSGMVASRIDLYTLTAIATREEVATYQVVINLLLYLQAGANFILLPFAKTLYRLDDGTIRKIAVRLFAFGVIAILPALWGMSWLMVWLYDLRYAGEFWLMAGAFALPIFGYLPVIHRLYGQNAQAFVLWVNIVGAIANGILNLWLIPPLGITGALMASAITQWAMLGAYILRNS